MKMNKDELFSLIDTLAAPMLTKFKLTQVVNSKEFDNLCALQEHEITISDLSESLISAKPVVVGVTLLRDQDSSVVKISSVTIFNDGGIEDRMFSPSLDFKSVQSFLKKNQIKFHESVSNLFEADKLKIFNQMSVSHAMALLIDYARNGILQKAFPDDKSKNNDSVFDLIKRKNNLSSTNVLHFCLRSYPYGGGEAFIKDSARNLATKNVRNVWVTFRDSDYRIHNQLRVVMHADYLEVCFPSVDTDVLAEKVLLEIVRIFGIDVINTQGELNEIVERIAHSARVPALVGYHFWNGLLELHNNNNSNILSNVSKHKLSKTFSARRSPYVKRYVVSDFMKDVLSKFVNTSDLSVVYPVPALSDYSFYKSKITPNSKKTVLQLNCSILKGGDVFVKLSKSIKNVKFEGYCATEAEFSELSKATGESADDLRALGITVGYEKDISKLLDRACMLLIPTKVDETFSKVVHEAVAAGVAVLSSGMGNIRYLLGKEAEYFDPYKPVTWQRKIESLINDKILLAEMARTQREFMIREFDFGWSVFNRLYDECASMITKYNIGFYVPWADQGLGIQARLYSKILKKADFRSHIFSFQSYLSSDKSLKYQSDEAEWAEGDLCDSVHYSYNDRESVTLHELKQFISERNIGKLIMPEVCWEVNWRKLLSLSFPNLMIYVVPNIETVRKSEVNYHNSVHRTLMNTKICENVLVANGVKNSHYIGHGMGSAVSQEKLKSRLQRYKSKREITFLHVGGYDSTVRKQTLKVVEAFIMLSKFRSDVRLKLAIQDRVPESVFNLINSSDCKDKIDLVVGNLRYSEVMELYSDSDVSVQVSSHEGLGLNFYEAVSNIVPVITVDVAPHNEIVLNDITGKLINPILKKLDDNDDSYCQYADFNVVDLVVAMNEFNSSKLTQLLPKLVTYFNANRTEEIFADRFIAGLYS